jgi:hypothetical protein
MDLFTALVTDLQDPAAGRLTACEVEELLAGRGREVLRQMVQDHLDLRAVREQEAARERGRAVMGAGGITRSRVETGHRRLLATLFGTVRVTRCAWRRPGAGKSLHAAADPAAEDWVAVKALAVLAGDSARTAAEITAEADAAVLTAGQRNGADTCVRYLTSKHEFLRYDQALAAGWPIATGVIEGACRHLIGDRLDITGARWGLHGAEAILTLRAVISNGDFDEYWHFHLAREHQRLYPGTTQGQYTLGA